MQTTTKLPRKHKQTKHAYGDRSAKRKNERNKQRTTKSRVKWIPIHLTGANACGRAHLIHVHYTHRDRTVRCHRTIDLTRLCCFFPFLLLLSTPKRWVSNRNQNVVHRAAHTHAATKKQSRQSLQKQTPNGFFGFQVFVNRSQWNLLNVDLSMLRFSSITFPDYLWCIVFFLAQSIWHFCSESHYKLTEIIPKITQTRQ